MMKCYRSGESQNDRSNSVVLEETISESKPEYRPICKMMRMKAKMAGLTTGPPPPPNNGSSAAAADDWEVRPGGMLVQKRTSSNPNRIPLPTIGELKTMLTGPMGLHREDQKLMYKNKERDSKKFLDITGVKEERPNL